MEHKEEKNVLELVKDKKVRGIAFFAFYGVIFLILIISVRNGNSNPNPKPASSSSPKPTASIKPTNEPFLVNNYNFVYTIKENDKTSIFEGKTFNNKQEFTAVMNGKTSSFYKLGDNYLQKKNSKYVVVSNPYSYFSFLDLTKLNEVIETSFEKVDNDITTYTVTVLDLFNIFMPDVNYDSFEISSIKDDKITITKLNNNINKVDYELSNFITYYSKLTKSNITKLIITLEYSNINKNVDFTIPTVE